MTHPSHRTLLLLGAFIASATAFAGITASQNAQSAQASELLANVVFEGLGTISGDDGSGFSSSFGDDYSGGTSGDDSGDSGYGGDDIGSGSHYCGDGTVDYDEECDEAEYNGLGDCSIYCRLKDKSTPPVCGDGIVEGDEQCDDGNGDNRDYCLTKCTLSFCGDGIVQAVRSEQCDDGNDDDLDACSNKCRTAFCGDGVVQTKLGEQCDRGDKNGVAGEECSSSCIKRTIIDEPQDDDDDESQSGGTQSSSTAPSSKASSSANQQTTTNENDDDDGDANDAEEARLKQLREQREALQKQLEENMRRAREQREAQESQTVDVETEEAEQPESLLVCFNEAGELVSNRELCAPNQEQFIISASDLKDEDIRNELRRKFLGENAAQLRQQELLESMQKARNRLQELLDKGEHRPEVATYFTEGINWIDRGIEYFSAAPRSLEEVQQMVSPVKQLVAQAQGLIQQEQNLPTEVSSRDITPILKKTERLLLKFRESFVALAQGGVELNQDALAKYVEAAELFNEVANTCVESGERCEDINQVLELLKVAQGPLQEDLGENPEILQAVQEKFAE